MNYDQMPTREELAARKAAKSLAANRGKSGGKQERQSRPNEFGIFQMLSDIWKLSFGFAFMTLLVMLSFKVSPELQAFFVLDESTGETLFPDSVVNQSIVYSGLVMAGLLAIKALVSNPKVFVGGVAKAAEQLRDRIDGNGTNRVEPVKVEVQKAVNPNLPPLELLGAPGGYTIDPKNNRAHEIVNALADFEIPSQVYEIVPGPVVTRYAIRLGTGISVRRVRALASDLALTIGVSSVRLSEEGGKIWLEIPNPKRGTVAMADLYAMVDVNKLPVLPLPLGVDTNGRPLILDLSDLPHLLIGGATKMGKSVAVQAMLIGLLMRHSPKTLRLALVDPKQVEFQAFETIPHLADPVVYTEGSEELLQKCVAEMERRYGILKSLRVKQVYDIPEDRWPFPLLVVIVDELADLVMTTDSAEKQIVRLAQKARAAGIHIVLATQRPDANIISGLIRSNVPSRVAVRCAKEADSRIILDQPGAEKLLGKGDMLALIPGESNMIRAQGAWVPTDLTEKLVNWWNERWPEKLPSLFSELSQEDMNKAVVTEKKKGKQAEDITEEDIAEAREVAVRNGKVSFGLLRDELGVGSGKAKRIMAEMEERGWVGPVRGNNPREVLIGKHLEERAMEFERSQAEKAKQKSKPVENTVDFDGDGEDEFYEED